MVRKVVITLAVAFSAAAATINKRILNGENATVGEFPFMVSVHDRSGEHYCGGTLLDGYHVLTAAHCAARQRRLSFVQAGAAVSLSPFDATASSVLV